MNHIAYRMTLTMKIFLLVLVNVHGFSMSPASLHPSIEFLSDDPKCFIIRDFLSKEECEKYIQRANNADPAKMRQSNAPKVFLQVDKLWPLPFLCLGAGLPPLIRIYTSSTEITADRLLNAVVPPIIIGSGFMTFLVYLTTTFLQIFADGKSRTSDSLALNSDDDIDFIRVLVDEASKVTGHHWTKWEAPVITKYRKGALFAKHNDASPTRGSEWRNVGGQRVVTVITYLNTCTSGGGTKFDRLGFTVQPQQGSALVFYPADSKTMEADERTVHQSLAAIDEKYIVQLFGRCERVPPPLGIPDSYM